ncbi:YncE family protein [Salegentibacter sp. F14]
MRKIFFLPLALLICIFSPGLFAQEYYIYVTAESEDEVALVRFDSQSEEAQVAKVIPVGYKSAEIEGPHGITVAPDGDHWFLSLAHGNPNGYLYKFSTGTDKLEGKTTLGLFPASMAISPKTGYLFCVNFNLHGEMVPGTVSVVEPDSMTEIRKIQVGVMPHGSRISPDGTEQYSVGMMSGDLFEINTMSFRVSRILDLNTNKALDPLQYEQKFMGHQMTGTANHNSHKGHKRAAKRQQEEMMHSKIKPTWVQPHPYKDLIYIAANGTDEILEIDSKEWKIINRMKTGKAPYNLDVTPDGKTLIASYKGDKATGIWNLESHKEIARVENTRKIIHGVAVSPDSRYAFISVEGIGGEPGTVDIIDLKSATKVANVEIGKQAGGIAFWKMEE